MKNIGAEQAYLRARNCPRADKSGQPFAGARLTQTTKLLRHNVAENTNQRDATRFIPQSPTMVKTTRVARMFKKNSDTFRLEHFKK